MNVNSKKLDLLHKVGMQLQLTRQQLLRLCCNGFRAAPPAQPAPAPVPLAGQAEAFGEKKGEYKIRPYETSDFAGG